MYYLHQDAIAEKGLQMDIDLLVLAGILPAIAYVRICYGIVRGQIRMNIATWMIWAIVNTITTSSIIASGFTYPWMNLAFTVGSFMVLLLSLRGGSWKWGHTETVCALAAVAAMTFWFFMGPTMALLLGVMAMAAGGIPQLIDTYHSPENQAELDWILFEIGSLLSLVGAPLWEPAYVLYPLVGALLNGLMVWFIVRGRWSSKPA